MAKRRRTSQQGAQGPLEIEALKRKIDQLFRIPTLPRRIPDRDWRKFLGPDEAEAAIRDMRDGRAQDIRLRRVMRPPKPQENAGRIVFNGEPRRRQLLRDVLEEAGTFFEADIKGESAGKEGAIVVLDLAVQLIDRLPLSEQERDILLGPLRFLHQSLEVLNTGGNPPVFAARMRSVGFPGKHHKSRLFQNELKIRCIIVFDLLRTFGMKDEEAAVEVYNAADVTAKALNLLQNEDRKFSQKTIRHWHARNTTLYNHYMYASGARGRMQDPHVIKRYHHELRKAVLGLKSQPPPSKISFGGENFTREEFQRMYLSTLQLEAILAPTWQLF